MTLTAPQPSALRQPLAATVNHALFDAFLTTDAMAETFGAQRLVQAMLDVEAALSEAQAAHGLVPVAAATTIRQACDAALYDIPSLLQAGRRAGSLAIPLVKVLTAEVARRDADAARHVHKGSTSQDILDTATVLQTAQALGSTLKAGPQQVAPSTTQSYPTPARRPLNSRLDTRKFRHAFGLTLPHWQTGVERMLTEIAGK